MYSQIFQNFLLGRILLLLGRLQSLLGSKYSLLGRDFVLLGSFFPLLGSPPNGNLELVSRFILLRTVMPCLLSIGMIFSYFYRKVTQLYVLYKMIDKKIVM